MSKALRFPSVMLGKSAQDVLRDAFVEAAIGLGPKHVEVARHACGHRWQSPWLSVFDPVAFQRDDSAVTFSGIVRERVGIPGRSARVGPPGAGRRTHLPTLSRRDAGFEVQRGHQPPCAPGTGFGIRGRASCRGGARGLAGRAACLVGASHPRPTSPSRERSRTLPGLHPSLFSLRTPLVPEKGEPTADI